MEDQNLHNRHIMPFCFKKKGINASQTCNKVCSVYENDPASMAKRWFVYFRSGILSVKDSSRPGRPTEIDTDKIKVQTLIKSKWMKIQKRHD